MSVVLKLMKEVRLSKSIFHHNFLMNIIDICLGVDHSRQKSNEFWRFANKTIWATCCAVSLMFLCYLLAVVFIHSSEQFIILLIMSTVCSLITWRTYYFLLSLLKPCKIPRQNIGEISPPFQKYGLDENQFYHRPVEEEIKDLPRPLLP